jgi:hypothetical protein
MRTRTPQPIAGVSALLGDDDPGQLVLVVQRHLPHPGVHVLHHARGELRIEIARTFSFAEAPEAHRVIETGHVRGKLVFDVTDSERPATSA